MHKALLLLGFLVALAAPPASAAVVGTLNFAGDSITAPIAFKDTFNSTFDAPGGLEFAIAPGQSGPVKLDLFTATSNVLVGAVAIDGFLKLGTVPISVTSDSLASGLHRFAISALANGASAIGYKLTLTPIPAPGLLLAAGLAGLVALHRRRV